MRIVCSMNNLEWRVKAYIILFDGAGKDEGT